MKTLQAITVPRWGMTMTEGTICAWMVREGDRVRAGQELVEIETTKITNVVEAPGDGVLRRAVLTSGQTAPVGALAGVLALSEVSDDEVEAFVASYAHRMVEAETVADDRPAPRLIEVGGHRINVLETGPASGDAVILVHGFGGDLASWLFNQAALSERYRVVAIDLPGHGASSTGVGAAPIDDMAQSVIGVAEALGFDRAHLVGHSLGGGVAAAMAAARPSAVLSLSLIAPIGCGPTIDGRYLSDFIAAQRRRPMQAVLERLFADPSKVTSDMVEDALRFKRLDGVPDALRAISGAIADGERQVQSLTGPLERLTCPVMLIWGEGDAIVPMPSAPPANADIRCVPNAGHMPQMEQAASVNDLILANIGRAGPGPR